MQEQGHQQPDNDMQRIAQYCHLLSIRSGKTKNQVMMEALRAFDVIQCAHDDMEKIKEAQKVADRLQINGKDLH